MSPTNHHPPRVSIGLPVYNGANYLAQALDAMLAQTFADFELIIADNASTDTTEMICRQYAQRDTRIRYVRHARNLGPAANFNHVVECATGAYFKWIAHDDLHAPSFVEKCVAALERNPDAVLAYSGAVTIDWQGSPIRAWASPPEWQSADVVTRWRVALRPPVDPVPLPIFGLIRTAVLRRTPLFTGLPDCDRALLAELSLHGRFVDIAEPLFLQREHKDRAGPALARDPGMAVAFWNSARPGAVRLPHFRLLGYYLAALRRVSLSGIQRLRCRRVLLRWLGQRYPALLADLWSAAEQWRGVGTVAAAIHRYRARAGWARIERRVGKAMARVIPGGSTLILVDNGSFGQRAFARWNTLPMIEKDGGYWGPPADDATAITELERLRSRGARFIVFAAPAFWWLTYYTGFSSYIQARFRCVMNNRQAVVYDLDTAERST